MSNMAPKDIAKIILAGQKANVSTLEWKGLKITYKEQGGVQSAPSILIQPTTDTPASEEIESKGSEQAPPWNHREFLLDELRLTDPLAFEQLSLQPES